MKKNIFHWVILLTLISCTKEQGVPGPTGEQGPAGANGKGSASDTASILGRLLLYNEFDQAQDPSGVMVTISSGSQQQRNATTDANGSYTFPGTTTGTYDLSFQKSGYGTMKLFGLSHFAGGTSPTQVANIDLLQFPDKTAPNTLTLTSNNPNTAVLDLRLDTSSLSYIELSVNMLVVVCKNRVGTPTDYDILLTQNNFPDGTGGYTINFYKLIQPVPLTLGDTLYAVAYTYNENIGTANSSGQGWSPLGLSGYYMDPQTGKYVYPNLSKPSNIVKFAY